MNITISVALRDYHARERAILATEPSVRAELLALGLTHVQADYDGVGDSGQIDEISFRDETEPGRFVPICDPLHQQVEDLLYALLNLRHGGWENNDGAFGSFRWNLADGSLEHEHNARFTDYNTSLHEGFGDAIDAGEGP